MKTTTHSEMVKRKVDSFARLRCAIVAPIEAVPVQPRRCVLDDQIIGVHVNFSLSETGMQITRS